MYRNQQQQPRWRGATIVASFIALGSILPHAANAGAARSRTALVARLESSVAVVLTTTSAISHDRNRVDLVEGNVLGSGVVISDDGLILTAAHVVEDAATIEVKLAGADPVSATIVFADESSDLALLKVELLPKEVVPAIVGDSDLLQKGEPILVLGNPFGIQLSLSVGVFSGRHSVADVFGGDRDLEVLQTDAAINTGSSGGPMFNERGELVGIAQRILSRSGTSSGMGFGISMKSASKVLQRDPCLWLGFSAVSLPQEWARALNLEGGEPLLVQTVVPGSPAGTAGLHGGTLAVQSESVHLRLGGDVITHIDGVPIEQWRRTAWAATTAGTRHELRLTVVRNGRTLEIPVATIHRTLWPPAQQRKE